MIQKIKRKKQIDNQDKQQPQTIQDLIRRYDLDNIEIKDYLDYLISYLKEKQNGTETAINTKLDKMVISKNLNVAGWYRVAKYNNAGTYAKSFIVNLNTSYSNSNNCSIILAVNISYTIQKISVINSVQGALSITKARLVKENDNTFLEIYYHPSVVNRVFVDIINQDLPNSRSVTLLEFEAPTDTATLLYQINIPETIRVYQGDLNKINENGVVYAGGNALNKPVTTNGYCITLIYEYDNNYKKQIFYTQDNSNGSFERICQGGVWDEWEGDENISVNLENGWEQYNSCQIFKDKNIVHLCLTVRNGTTTTILTLPEKYRPAGTIFLPATINGSGTTDPYVAVSKSGAVQCANVNIGKLIFINASYKV